MADRLMINCVMGSKSVFARRFYCSRVVARILAVALLGLLVAPKSYAWGEVGHATICQMAWLQVSDQTKRWLTPVYRAKGYKSFAQSCNWADHIKSQSRFDYLKPHHYVNLPSGSRNYNPHLAQCGQKSCITKAINQHQRALTRNKSANLDEAALLLAHFIGDIHQPMHVSHAEDWGGNKLALSVPGDSKRRNLHWLWDVWMVEQAGVKDWHNAAPRLLEDVRPAQRAKWQADDDVHLWAKESYRQTQQIYREYNQNKKIGQIYAKRHKPMVIQRLQQAGVRLAARLELITQTR